jgi:hypothetical protein
MILEQFLINKTKEIDNPISNWGIGFTAEVIKEWIDLQVKVKKLTIPVVIVEKRTLCVCAEVHGTARNSENELVCKDCYEPLIA